MHDLQTEEHNEYQTILHHWVDETLEAYPDYALPAQNIITRLLRKHDPEKWKEYSLQKAPEVMTFHSLGFAQYLIARELYRYEMENLKVDKSFLNFCKIHLHLLPYDGTTPPWVNPQG